MTNVIAFRRPAERQINDRPMRGATLFLHIKQTALIAHLAKPQGNRAVKIKKSSRS
ncbi:MAG: hypothetical protein HKP37_08205 [Boseongicola sp.]|nr:hypothetical protein [Boseongicola sp.]NNL18705.1 hypothetical protein [Boseongicola sp.]